MTKRYDIITLSISVAWIVFSICLMAMYTTSKFGPTPIYLPITLAFMSLSGVITVGWWLYSKKIQILSAIISTFLYVIGIILQIKALGEIMYAA